MKTTLIGTHLPAIHPTGTGRLVTTERKGLIGRPPGSKNKYRNIRTEVDGIWFASKAEADRYKQLRLLEKIGDVKDLEMQPRYEFTSETTGVVLFKYLADFRYKSRRGKSWVTVVEDVKGFLTREFRLKQKLIEDRFGIEIVLVKRKKR